MKIDMSHAASVHDRSFPPLGCFQRPASLLTSSMLHVTCGMNF